MEPHFILHFPMEPIVKIGVGGGLLAILVFIHFLVDWIFQTHKEAMNKHNKPWVRARHCGIYAVGFIPFLTVLVSIGSLSFLEYFISLNILFWSHFVEDTYYPVYLWAKYIRRPAEMTEPIKEAGFDGYINVLPPDPRKGFLLFINTTLGKILMIAVDQIIHIAFLIPIVWMALN